MRICPKRDAVCPHGMDCPFTIDQYECREGGSDIRSRLEECQLSMATRGQFDERLSPHLWEQLRQRLQKIYRKATGEPMAVLSVDDASPSPISADAVVEACAKVADDVAKEWASDAELWHKDGMLKTAAISLHHSEAAEKVAAAIRALKGTFPALDGWRTMDSAPKDGGFLGWDQTAGMRFIMVGNHFGEKRYYDADALENGNYIRAHPTHWVRLTPPAVRSSLVDPEGGV